MKKEANIAEFKSHLSEYLRAVRRGHEVVIKDRETPVAVVVPYKAPRKRLVTIPPTESIKTLDQLPYFRPKGLRPGAIDEALEWVRQDRFEDGLL